MLVENLPGTSGKRAEVALVHLKHTGVRGCRKKKISMYLSLLVLGQLELEVALACLAHLPLLRLECRFVRPVVKHPIVEDLRNHCEA